MLRFHLVLSSFFGNSFLLIFEAADLAAFKNSGNIARQTLTVPGTSFVQSYSYDSVHRLTEAVEKTGTTTNWSQQFGYDRYGNRTSFAQDIGGITKNTTLAVDANTNRFTSTDFGYDANGNIVGDIDEVTNLPRQFIFNGDNKQTEVKRDGITIGRYYYDGEGRRVKKVTDTETTVFVYSGGLLIAEYSTNVVPVEDAKVSYTTADHLGSPRVITNQNAQVTSRRDFMPFGEELYAGVGTRTGDTGLKYSSTDDDIRQKFTGYERDIESELDFAEARMYGYQHGRFTSPDPSPASKVLRLPQSMNRYVYVMNNPFRYIDPTGLIWVQAAGCSESTCQLQWIPDDDWNEMSEEDRKPYEEIKVLTYNSVTGKQVVLDPRGPNPENPAGWSWGGPNTDSPAFVLGGTAVVVSQLDSPVPGPADIVALVVLAAAGVSALMHEGPRGLPLDPNLYNKNKDIENKVAGLIAAAEIELAKLATDPPGPGGPRNHHRGEIKAMLEKAKQKLRHHGGGAAKKLLEQIERIEKAADKIMNIS